MYLSIRHFRYFLERRAFTVFTDHKPLTYCMSKVSEPWSSRQQHHLSYISEFTTDIQHIQGKNNQVADTMLRATVLDVHLGTDYKAIAEAQKGDPEVQILHTGKSNLVIKEVAFTGDGPTLLCDMSTGRARPIVPTSWKQQVFEIIHNLSHPSVCAT